MPLKKQKKYLFEIVLLFEFLKTGKQEGISEIIN